MLSNTKLILAEIAILFPPKALGLHAFLLQIGDLALAIIRQS